MRTIFAAIIIGVTSILSTTIVITAWACNPNANCMYDKIVYCPTWKYPRRLCHHKEEDLGCAIARKACQADCGKINADASNYITQYYAEIGRISGQIQTIEDFTNREQEYRLDMERSLNSLEIKSNEALDGLKSVRKLVAAQAQLQSALYEANLSSALIDQFLETSKTSSNEQVALLALIIEQASQLNANVSKDLSLARIEDLLKIIGTIFQNQFDQIKIDREILQNRLSVTDQNIAKSKNDLKTAVTEISNLQSKINQQEVRKCTPW